MPRLLVVDDDTVTCRLLADVFKRDGYAVIGETNPQRALARVAGEPIDLAILDVQMPEMDGLALLRGLRERLPDLPVVIMTAFGSIDTAVQAIASGAVDYVSKPMDVEEIRATVRRALGRTVEAQATLPAAGEQIGGVVGRSPAMVEVVRRFGVGVVAPSFTPHDVAATLDRLTVDQVEAMRTAALHAARTLNADVEMHKIVDLYDGLWANREVGVRVLAETA